MKLIDSVGVVVDTLSYSGQASDDEIIIAERFLEVTTDTNSTPRSLEDLAFVGQGPLITGTSSVPLLVALIIAITSGLLIGFLQKRMNEK